MMQRFLAGMLAVACLGSLPVHADEASTDKARDALAKKADDADTEKALEEVFQAAEKATPC